MQEVWIEQNITGARMRSVSPRRHTWLFLCSYALQRTFLQLPVALPCTESGNLWIVGLATWIYLTNPLFPHKHHLLFRPSLSFSFSQSSNKYKKKLFDFRSHVELSNKFETGAARTSVWVSFHLILFIPGQLGMGQTSQGQWTQLGMINTKVRRPEVSQFHTILTQE